MPNSLKLNKRVTTRTVSVPLERLSSTASEKGQLHRKTNDKIEDVSCDN